MLKLVTLLFDRFSVILYHLGMEEKIINCLTEYVDYLELVEKNQSDRAKDLSGFESITLSSFTKPSGRKYYNYKRPGFKKFKYLGKETCEDVQNVKEAHYYKISIPKIRTNLELCRQTLQRLERTDYDSIVEVLPKVYSGAALKTESVFRKNDLARDWKARNEAYKESKGPWFPEDLTCTTVDRKKVRSKSEALIYNHYYNENCTFVYELPIELFQGIMRHPDFTVLCETDWSSFILHDHEGRYGFNEDRKRYNNDMYLYWKKGFIPGINIFYTFDDPNGGFDITVVQNIIDTRVRPRVMS